MRRGARLPGARIAGLDRHLGGVDLHAALAQIGAHLLLERGGTGEAVVVAADDQVDFARVHQVAELAIGADLLQGLVEPVERARLAGDHQRLGDLGPAAGRDELAGAPELGRDRLLVVAGGIP
ncbi:MAG TPA: hypothetical protein VNL16_05250, partial [Chloroflexota bacterium]|nr:hypothetical protein [Chloroflexota bacterium]